MMIYLKRQAANPGLPANIPRIVQEEPLPSWNAPFDVVPTSGAWSEGRGPGWNGLGQAPSTAGWHALGHTGKIEGLVLAEYELTGQLEVQLPPDPNYGSYASQAGTRTGLVNLYSVHYMSM